MGDRSKNNRGSGSGRAGDRNETGQERNGLLVELKATPTSVWICLGLGIYFVVALAIAGETADEAGSFGMALLVALIGLVLLIVIYVIPTLIVIAIIGYILYLIVQKHVPTFTELKERRKANRAARSAGLPTERQRKKQIRRALRVERARRSCGHPPRMILDETRIRSDHELHPGRPENLQPR